MYYTKEYLKRAHREIDTIFRVLFPEHGMAVREEQIMLCHEMLDNLLGRNIALCDAGVGIGKTYAYLVACVLMRKYSLLAEGCSPYEQRPVVISTSSIALQKAILTEYIPFLSRILQENGTIQAPIKAVIRKGKEHFVCDERLEQRIVAIEEKNKNALQKEALLSLKEHYDIRDTETWDIVLLPTKYLMHMTKAKCSPNTVRRSGCSILYYLEYIEEKEKKLTDVYEMSFTEQTKYFVEFLYWLKAGKHTSDKMNILPNNGTCNAYRSAKISAYTFQFLNCYIAEYRKILQHQSYLFVNISGRTVGNPLTVDAVYAMLKRMEKKTGIKITPHMLRHYFGNERRKAGWALELIQIAYGHRHIQTTINYLDIVDDELLEASQEFYKKNTALYGIDELL